MLFKISEQLAISAVINIMIICGILVLINISMTNQNDDNTQSNDDNTQSNDDSFYSNDVQAAAMADNNMDPDDLDVKDEIPVTTGDMEIGDLDDDEMEGQGSEESYDEESVPAGDNVIDN